MATNQLEVVSQSVQTVESQHTGMITPAGSIEDAVQQFKLYQELKQRLGVPNDFKPFENKKTGEVKLHPKKSFVRKIQRFFNISCDIIQDEPFYDQYGNLIAWLVKAKAIHTGTGAYQVGDGCCSFEEKIESQRTLHNIRSQAVTRAKNRAILDLVGFGDVSAEEIHERDYQKATQQTEPPQSQGDLKGNVTKAQLKKLGVEQDKRGLTDKWMKALVSYFYKKESRADLTKAEASELIDKLMKMNDAELGETLTKVKASFQESKQEPSSKVYDVDPDTGEVISEEIDITSSDNQHIPSDSEEKSNDNKSSIAS